jgi:hypothetical protein
MPIIVGVSFLFGEWIPASAYLGFAFLVALLGVGGLGWWVLKGEARNRRVEGEDL